MVNKGILLGILIFTILIAGVSAETTQDYVIIYKDDANLGKVKLVIEETNTLQSILNNLFLSFKDTSANVGEEVDIEDSVIKIGCTSSTVPYKKWTISILRNNQVVSSWDVTDQWDKLSGCNFKVTAFFVPGTAGLYTLKSSTTSASGSTSSHTGTNELVVIDPDAEDDCVWGDWEFYQDVTNGKKYIRENPCEDDRYKIECNSNYIETNGACVFMYTTPCSELLETPCKSRPDCSWNTVGINKCKIKGSGGTTKSCTAEGGECLYVYPFDKCPNSRNEILGTDCSSIRICCQKSTGTGGTTGCESLDKVSCQADSNCEWGKDLGSLNPAHWVDFCKTKSGTGTGTGTGNGNGGTGGITDKVDSLTFNEYYSTADSELLKSGCTVDTDCKEVDGYETSVCLLDKAAKKRLFNGYKQNCEEAKGSILQFTPGLSLIIKIYNSIIFDDCKLIGGVQAWIDGDNGVCIAKSKTWYGKLWDKLLNIVGGLGLPGQYVMLAAWVAIILVIIIALNLIKK